ARRFRALGRLVLEEEIARGLVLLLDLHPHVDPDHPERRVPGALEAVGRVVRGLRGRGLAGEHDRRGDAEPQERPPERGGEEHAHAKPLIERPSSWPNLSPAERWGRGSGRRALGGDDALCFFERADGVWVADEEDPGGEDLPRELDDEEEKRERGALLQDDLG